ncbi:MAG: carbohydrate kinase family protein [Hydrogenophaga sp.]|uniref:carbohydrate kinase family protein n=1 Tax=Hydrogenophaga sp. TaxID=1904254 RepID=UPI002726672F|nr:carbohydrate kinase family protein [Hydrogenophaga sp.]MDO9146407.1 carbohydrate kinase family protein [Hydrogenophaga sp.]MDO9605491.1 carbohydrate kinase family protein [Hydrogenophaga sp.]
MSILVCGSLAFDTIMTFEGRFAEQILPSQLHILNVSFLVPGLRREYGGCAGNIAYGLRQLGSSAVPLAMVGNDAQDYLGRLQTLGVNTQFIGITAGNYTAQAMIMTDRDNNQITAFHPGAMSDAHTNAVPTDAGVKLAIISPDGRDAMLQHAQQLHTAGIPFVFDPGQGLPMFNGEELTSFIELASWVTVNDYEGEMLSDRTGLSFEDIAARVNGLIVTLGEQGCEVWEGGQKTLVPGVKAAEVLDPTGCGDAFRAALLHGLSQGWSLPRCAELGNKIGATKIASRGGQNYQFAA